jgi:uncharacterized protein
MLIDWNNFTPWASLIGGGLIGLASALLVLANGRIAGISGIVAGLLQPKKDDLDWRLLFLGGMITAPLLYRLAVSPPDIQIDADWTTLVLAGLLVGAGTRFASGCTSGHGVCGLSRLSPRSLIATLTFMAAGFATVYLTKKFMAGWETLMLGAFLAGVATRFAPECGRGVALCIPSRPSRRRLLLVMLALFLASVAVVFIIMWRLQRG